MREWDWPFTGAVLVALGALVFLLAHHSTPAHPRSTADGVPAATTVRLPPSRTHAASTPPPTNAVSAPTPARPRKVQAAIVGDGYTFGIGAHPRTAGFAYLLASKLGWTRVAIKGFSGAGYAKPSPRRKRPIGAAIPAIIKRHPKVILVVAGHNDANSAPTLIESAAYGDLAKLHAGLPAAKIVVVGPIWPDAFPTTGVLNARTAIHTAATQAGDVWIDPILEQWFTGSATAHTGNAGIMDAPDGTHLNDLGHEYVAALLARDLRALGIR